MFATLLSFITGPIGSIAGVVVAAGVVFGVGFYKGDVHRGAADAAAEAAVMAAWQTKQTAAAKAAEVADMEALTKENDDLKTQIAAAKDAVSKVSPTECFNPADMTQLKRLWPHAKTR